MIRTITAQDETRWREMWGGYNLFYDRVTSVSDEATNQTWHRLLSPDVEPYGFLATDETGTPLGFTHYWFQDSTAQLGRRIYLQDLYVDPEARGSGYGRALIEAVYAVADKTNAYEVYWLTQDFNEAGRRLYDRVGKVTPFIKYMR